MCNNSYYDYWGYCGKCGAYAVLKSSTGLCIYCEQEQITYPQQFNYECPDCHGKFNQPSIPSVTSSIYYKCPFCGRFMEVLK